MSKSLGAATTAAAAANEFLQLGWAVRDVPPITQMKLQKLLFYAHSWHLALEECPLFGEDFEAWPWGPVQRDIYFATKSYGKQPISELISSFNFEDLWKTSIESTNPRVSNENTRSFISSVWESHKRFTGVQLSNSTHAPGEPWTIIKEKFGTDHKPTIPNELIYAVFKKKLNVAA